MGAIPSCCPKPVFRQIATSTAATLKEFLAASPRKVAFCELDDPGLDLDIDYPEDYQNALQRAGLAPKAKQVLNRQPITANNGEYKL